MVIRNRFTKKKKFRKILVWVLLVMRWYDIQWLKLIMEKKFYQNRFLTYSLHQEFVLSCSFFALAYFFLHFVLLSIDKHFEVSLEHGVQRTLEIVPSILPHCLKDMWLCMKLELIKHISQIENKNHQNYKKLRNCK